MRKDDVDPLNNTKLCQRIMRQAIYITTAPDIALCFFKKKSISIIAHVVSDVSQYMNAPHTTHLQVVRRILQYLKGSPGKEILFKYHGHLNIIRCSDADWTGSLNSHKSTSKSCIFLRGNLVTWKTKKY